MNKFAAILFKYRSYTPIPFLILMLIFQATSPWSLITGFIIALIWKDVIIGLMKLAGWWQEGGFADTNGAVMVIVVAIFITIVAVLGILFISKWGGIEKK